MIGAVEYGPLRAEVIILKHMKNRSGFEYFQTKTDSRAKFERNRLFEAKFTVPLYFRDCVLNPLYQGKEILVKQADFPR